MNIALKISDPDGLTLDDSKQKEVNHQPQNDLFHPFHPFLLRSFYEDSCINFYLCFVQASLKFEEPVK